METTSVHALVTGRVQGVGFRAFTAATARRLGLTGWVRNLPDGSVEALAEGARRDLDEFVTALRSGPPAARVTDVVTRWEDPAAPQAAGFEVRP